MARFWLAISRGSRRPLLQSLLAAHFDQLCAARLGTSSKAFYIKPLIRELLILAYRPFGSGSTALAWWPPPHARLARWVSAHPAGGDTRGLCLWVSIVFVLVAVPCLAADFRLSSPVLKDKDKIVNEQVFSGFGCTGGNVSPELQWQNAPKDTKSFAVTVYDPDAPTGSGWWHWVIFDIPSTVNKLPANAGKPESGLAPQGSIQSTTDFGQPGYGGPCPPVGDKPHRYIFTVYALKVDQLPLKQDASGAMVGYYLNQNVLAKATFTAFYGR